MPLSESGLTNVCSQLGTDAAAIWAVLHVESARCGFLADRRPVLGQNSICTDIRARLLL